MKKYIGGTVLIALISSIYFFGDNKQEVYTVDIQLPWFGGVMPCYNPRDWLENEDDGGIWTIVTSPDNSGFSDGELLVGDDPCVPVNDCGPFHLRYCVECESCEDLQDCVDVFWDIPCCPPDPDPTCN